jgi:hypothetical protein
MTWWTVREELLVGPVAACIYGCCCRAGMRAMGWKMLRSGRKMSFFARCSNTRAPTSVAAVRSTGAFKRYIGGVWKKLSCSHFLYRQTR